MKIIQLGVGAYGVGAMIEDGQAALEIRKSCRPGKVGNLAFSDDPKFTDDGVIILLGNRKAAKVLMRRLRMAMELLPR